MYVVLRYMSSQMLSRTVLIIELAALRDACEGEDPAGKAINPSDVADHLDRKNTDWT